MKLPIPVVAGPEALLAIIGIKPVISREVEKVYRAQLREASNIGKKVLKLGKDLVNGNLDDTYHSDLDYTSTLKDLARGFDVNQVQAMAAAFPPEYRAQAAGFVLLASSLSQELLKMYPVSTYATVTGSINQLPSDLKFWKFVNLLEVLDDPLTVFPLMATGALLRSQARAVRLVYPSLSAAIDASILQATVAAKTAKKSFELAPFTEIGVKAWFDKSPVSPQLLRRFQANHVAAAAAKQPPAPPTSNKTIDFDGSPSERAVYANV